MSYNGNHWRSAKLKLNFAFSLKSTMALWISTHHPMSTWLMKEVTETYHDQAYRSLIGSTDYYKFSFYPSTIVLWNGLSQASIGAPNVLVFKAALAPMN